MACTHCRGRRPGICYKKTLHSVIPHAFLIGIELGDETYHVWLSSKQDAKHVDPKHTQLHTDMMQQVLPYSPGATERSFRAY